VCTHNPPCPQATAPDEAAAKLERFHAAQGWGLRCNGSVAFDDTGELLPNGRIVPPRRSEPLAGAA
jgi:hypothetical protein